jgi:hypothetical protein
LANRRAALTRAAPVQAGAPKSKFLSVSVTRVAGLFPNEASLLRLITALLNEIIDEWHTAKIYLNMDNYPQPSV